MGFAHCTTSSNSVGLLEYDVFISFRGEDVRGNFLSHLCKALRNEQIKVYLDEITLRKGEQISSALLKAIQKSKISLIIFSENYASSSWCLDELVNILKCREENKQMVVPIFYRVDPSHVRKQKGSFAQAFVAHQQCPKDRMEKQQMWRDALETACSICGWDSRNRNESKLIEEIVEYVVSTVRQRTTADSGGPVEMNGQFKKSEFASASSYISSRTTADSSANFEYAGTSSCTSLRNSAEFEGLVGINRQLMKFELLLRVGSPDVRILGIWGMGGIGKTTLASVVFNIFSSQFEGSCFVANVGEETKKFGLAFLEYRLFSHLLKEEDIGMVNDSIKERIRRRKVLIVLDDVDDLQQLERLAGDRTWFGPGSRVIITTRNRHLLRYCCADEIYEVDGLNFDEALELFRSLATIGRPFISGYAQLSESLVHYAGGIPLAVQVTGSLLDGRRTKEWETTLDELEEISDKFTYELLRVSYDGLDDMETDIFLDIARFLKRGHTADSVRRILKEFGSAAKIGIAVLVDKSLISIKGNGDIYMHGLIQRMARQIDRLSTQERKSNYWSSINKGIWFEGRDFDKSTSDNEERPPTRTVFGKRYESYSTEEIVEKVVSKLSCASSRTTASFTGLVGLNRQVKKFESLFYDGSSDVRVLGIWGMGGIGKTTLARVVFNRFSSQFKGRCFLENIRKRSKRGLPDLVRITFSQLLGVKNRDHMGKPNFKERIRPKKVLIVLDDADHSKQLKCLVEYRAYFKSGSRVIITTRDRHLLRQVAVDEIYEVDGLNFDEALELFCLNAFRGRHFTPGYAQLSQSVVHYAHGIPLALIVIGSFLCGRSIKEWKSELNKLIFIPLNDIYNVLITSFHELDEVDKEIFLHIACNLEGRNRDFIERKLDDSGFHASTGIEILMDKCLISINKYGEIHMHDLMRRTAWEIVRQSYHESKYWSSINKRIGVEGRFFDMSSFDNEELRLRSTIFESRCHNCYDYPQKPLLPKINPHNLVELDMPCGQLKQFSNEVKDSSSSSTVRLIISYEGQWKETRSCWSFKGKKAKGIIVSKDITYHQLVERIGQSLMVDRQQYDLDMRFLVVSLVPLPPIEIQNDDDVKFLIRETSREGSPGYPLCVTLVKKDAGQHVLVDNDSNVIGLLFKWKHKISFF